VALAYALTQEGAVVRAVRLPPGEGGKKVGADDYLLTHTVEELKALMGAAVDTLAAPDAPAWPAPPAAEALHGLAGRIVRAIEPASEADVAALLVQLLVAFGSAAGRGA
jgi:hypothetical protein